jgi:hypothetical protein
MACCKLAGGTGEAVVQSNEPSHWFPSKRYGWGWGLPVRWLGWLVLTAYMCLLGLCVWVAPPLRNQLAFFGLVGLLTALLVAICWVKGEPPKWRWGRR